MVDQLRVIDRECFSIWRLDIDHQVGGAGRDGINVGRQFLRFGPVDRLRGFLRIAKVRPISNHLALVASGKKWKSLWTGRTLEGEKAIAVNASITREDFVQL